MGSTYKKTLKHLATERILHGGVVKKASRCQRLVANYAKHLQEVISAKGAILATEPKDVLTFPTEEIHIY